MYVDPRHQRRGAGRALYHALFGRLAERDYRIALAGIALPNDASVALHRACGFKRIGAYRGIGFKLGKWWDVEWWQLDLVVANGSAPGEPGLPAQVDDLL